MVFNRRANASKHKAMSYQRMNEQEERLVREVEELLARADAADRRDDMVKDGAFVQGYNARTAVDAASQVIVAEAVTHQAPDCEHLVPMVDRVETNCGQKPAVLTADNGYFSRNNVAACEQRGVDAHIAVGRERARATPSSQDPVREQMRTKLRSPQGKAIYARRKTIVEPPFGQIKQARGFRRFSLRGLAKVRGEWTFVCLTHNLLKLFRAPRGSLPGARGRVVVLPETAQFHRAGRAARGPARIPCAHAQ